MSTQFHELCSEKWYIEIGMYFIRFEAALKSEIRISKHETNSDDRNFNNINEKQQYHTEHVLNFDIRIFTMFDAFRQYLWIDTS